MVGHMVTQDDYGRIPGRVYVDYDAVGACLREVARAAAEGVPGTVLAGGFASVAMPKFGAGLAGGDWRRIEAIVERECGHLDVTVHVVSPSEIPQWARSPAP
jgi:O-acetyl-ADP-ribose deacetylase (regulator of RNase III)